jgi:hypothetical protein
MFGLGRRGPHFDRWSTMHLIMSGRRRVSPMAPPWPRRGDTPPPRSLRTTSVSRPVQPASFASPGGHGQCSTDTRSLAHSIDREGGCRAGAPPSLRCRADGRSNARPGRDSCHPEDVAGSSRGEGLILTTFEQDDYVLGALRAGASGFLLKRARPEELISAVQTIAAGDSLLSPSVTRRVIDTHGPAANSRARRSGQTR